MEMTRARICGIVVALLCLSAGNFSHAGPADSWPAWIEGAGADSDGDLITDNQDNCTLVANVDQHDTDADGFGNVCDPDFNNDKVINFGDLAIMKANFLDEGDLVTDLTVDGVTNFADLALLKAAWLALPGPTGTDPEVSNCNCYFPSDCPGTGMGCEYGPGSFFVEDICYWRLPKPEGIPGTGCDTEYEGPWSAVCDGICVQFTTGSSIGEEDPALVAKAVELWSEALVAPSLAGGGPVDARIATQAQNLPFRHETTAVAIGRYVADVLSVTSDFGFYDHFCHYESYPDEPPAQVIDLSADTCRASAAGLAVDALSAEMSIPGSGASHLLAIAGSCGNWQSMFAPTCATGPGALDCLVEWLENKAHFLTTPRQVAAAPRPLEERLRERR